MSSGRRERSVERGRGAGPRRRASEATLELREGRHLRVAIISDTHSHPHPRSAEWIAALAPDAILHAGDIGDLGVLDTFGAIAPVIAVRGNIDERAPHLPDDVVIRLSSNGQIAMTILLTHVAVAGARVRADAARLARQHGASLIVCGHSHVPFLGRDRGLTVFNAGSIGPRRFALPIVFGVMQIEDGRLSLRHVDCETGRTWTP